MKGMVNIEAPLNSNTISADGIFLIQSTPRCLNYSIFALKMISPVFKPDTELIFALMSTSLPLSKTQKRKKEEM